APAARRQPCGEVEHLVHARERRPERLSPRHVPDDDLDRQAPEGLRDPLAPDEAAHGVPSLDEAPDEVAADEPVAARDEDAMHEGGLYRGAASPRGPTGRSPPGFPR